MPAGTIADWFISGKSAPPSTPTSSVSQSGTILAWFLGGTSGGGSSEFLPTTLSNGSILDYFIGTTSTTPSDPPPTISDGSILDYFTGIMSDPPPDPSDSFSNGSILDYFIGTISGTVGDGGSGGSGVLSDWFLGTIGSGGGAGGGGGSGGGGSGGGGSGGGSGSGSGGYSPLDLKWIDYITVNARRYLEAFFRRFTRIKLKIKELYFSGYDTVIIPPSELVNYIEVSYDNTTKILTVREKINNPIPDNLKTPDKKYLFYVCIKPSGEDLGSFLTRITPLLDPDNPPPEVVLVFRIYIYPDVKPPYR
jgi:hypothetical protein